MSDSLGADDLTPSGKHVRVDLDTLHTISGRSAESWPGVARTALVTVGTVAIVYIHRSDASTARYGLGVLLLAATPALARAVLAPILARALKAAQ